MSDLKSAIHPEALDLVLDSANNAAQKGQSQYSTPVEIAAALSEHLPRHRPVLVDLTCGPGQLLAGAVNSTTEHRLGLDVDPRGKSGRLSPSILPQTPTGVAFHFIHGDLTALYEPMRQIHFRADCFVLNPPWSLAWHATRLEGLADSAVPAVAKTFKVLAHGALSPTIDSTLATLMIALDRLTDNGEGLLIGYTSTLQRLLFESDGAALEQHIWKLLPLPAGPWGDAGMATAIYFSACHDTGPTANGEAPLFMHRVHGYNPRRDTVDKWAVLSEKAASLLPNNRSPYHLALTASGALSVRLGLFDTALKRIDKEMAKAADRLSELHGRNPMQVVMQRDERNFILGLIHNGSVEAPLPGDEGGAAAPPYPWRVDPALRDAVQKAVNDYNAIRAPLAPLPKIQRLGYLDESDDILCIADLTNEKRPGASAPYATVFHAGQRYALSTQSVRFTRAQLKTNIRGELEELQLSGQELAIFVKSSLSADHEGNAVEKGSCFMDASLREDNVQIDHGPGAEFVHFTLQDLVKHFEIPEVPDIAGADAARHQTFITQLHQLEQLTQLEKV
jgi:predicted RNA methylase